jgi:hypothetical protein
MSTSDCPSRLAPHFTALMGSSLEDPGQSAKCFKVFAGVGVQCFEFRVSVRVGVGVGGGKG